jgi:hypothetical protein
MFPAPGKILLKNKEVRAVFTMECAEQSSKRQASGKTGAVEGPRYFQFWNESCIHFSILVFSGNCTAFAEGRGKSRKKEYRTV